MGTVDLTDLPIHRIAASLAAGEFTCGELVRGYLDRIDREDGEIGAFLKIDRAAVLDAALAADERRRRKEALSEFD